MEGRAVGSTPSVTAAAPALTSLDSRREEEKQSLSSQHSFLSCFITATEEQAQTRVELEIL